MRGEASTLLRGLTAGSVKVALAGLIAATRYRPGFYPGKLTVFTPLRRDPALPDSLAVWGAHAAGLAYIILPGTHATMLTRAHALEAAAALSRQLALATLPCPLCGPGDSGI